MWRSVEPRTGRRGCGRTAARWCAPCSSRKPAPNFPTSGTSSDCAAPAATATRVTDLFVPESHTRVAGSRAEAPPAGPALRASAAAICIPPASPGSRSALRAALWTLCRARPRQDPARRQAHVARQQCGPVASRAIAKRGSAASRAFLLSSLEQIWRDVARSRRLTLDHNTTIRLASTWAIHQARDVVDSGLSRGRSDGDLREQPVRAPLARRPHGDPAISRPPGAFRNGRPDTARPSGRGHDVHVLTADDGTRRTSPLFCPAALVARRYSMARNPP